MALQKQIIHLIKQLSTKYDLPDYVIEKILTSEFKAIKEWIRSGNFETIQLLHWGKYTPSKLKMKRRNERLKSEENINNSLS